LPELSGETEFWEWTIKDRSGFGDASPLNTVQSETLSDPLDTTGSDLIIAAAAAL
jgi:hypothetical protein